MNADSGCHRPYYRIIDPPKIMTVILIKGSLEPALSHPLLHLDGWSGRSGDSSERMLLNVCSRELHA